MIGEFKLKICFLNSYYSPNDVGGAERSVKFLAESFLADGHEVHVLACGETDRSERIDGVDVSRRRVRNVYWPLKKNAKPGALSKLLWHAIDAWNPRMAMEVGTLLDRIKPDVLHTNTLAGWSVAVWSEARRRGIPIVHTLRDYYLLCPSTSLFKDGKNCEKQCGRCQMFSKPKKPFSELVDVVVGNSQYILSRHVDDGWFPKAQQKVIYNAYRPSRAPSPLARQEKPVFGYIGRLAATKGVDSLLDAIRQNGLADKLELVVAGGGPADYVDELKKRAAGLPVRFLGQVQAEDYYDQVHFTIVPSMWHEPLARVLFESYAHAVPVVASNTGGTPEVVDVGKTGFIYDPFALGDLGRALSNAIASYRDTGFEQMRERCLERAKDFLPERVVREYGAAYAAAGQKNLSISSGVA